MVAIVSDAAREQGTGFAAYAAMRPEAYREAAFYYAEERWSTEQQAAFDSGAVSMPFGELFGMVVYAIALIERFPDITAIYMFTDCDAAKAAVNSGASPSPQMNALQCCCGCSRKQGKCSSLHSTWRAS